MSTLEINRCAVCGKLFHSLGTNICAPCSEQVDKDFLKVRDYIYSATENVGLKEILESTGVPEKTVLYLMKEGRLTQNGIKMEGSLKCAVCGAGIARGKLCSRCSAIWNAESRKLKPPRDNNQEKTDRIMNTGARMHTRYSKNI